MSAPLTRSAGRVASGGEDPLPEQGAQGGHHAAEKAPPSARPIAPSWATRRRPVVVGVIHGAVAMLDLSTLLDAADASAIVLSTFGAVSLLYGSCFAVYYAVARVTYTRRVRAGAPLASSS